MLLDHFRRTQAVSYGDFTLASAKQSDIYVDCRRLTLDSEGLYAVTTEFMKLMNNLGYFPGYIGGPTSAIIAGLVLRYRCQGFFVRKEAKDHGTKKQYEGHMGDCILFDDVATSGESLVRCIKVVNSYGCKVHAAMVIVDHEEGAKELLFQAGVPLYSLLTFKDLR